MEGTPGINGNINLLQKCLINPTPKNKEKNVNIKSRILSCDYFLNVYKLPFEAER